MTVKIGYWSDLTGLTFSEDHKSWIQAARFGTYQHPVYGVINFTKEKLQSFADGVKNKIRGIPPDIDYDHKMDVARGGKAAGWVQDAEVRSDGLWLLVEWTAEAVQAIKDKAYRFFSPEFDDEWTDAQGVTHKDVLFGGGLTNRPFLKDLLPVNLSELTFSGAPATPPEPPVPPAPPTKETEVDLKKFAVALGLSETATEEEVWKKFGEKMAPPTPPNTPPAPPPTPAFQLTEDMKKLAEANPAVGALMTHVQKLAEENADNTKRLREQAVGAKLSEFDRAGGKLALSPAAKELIAGLALKLGEEDEKLFWNLLTNLRDGQATFVELGERGGAVGNYTRNSSAEDKFNAAVTKKLADNKGMQYADAVGEVANEQPQLYKEYRDDVYITRV